MHRLTVTNQIKRTVHRNGFYFIPGRTVEIEVHDDEVYRTIKECEHLKVEDHSEPVAQVQDYAVPEQSHGEDDE